MFPEKKEEAPQDAPAAAPEAPEVGAEQSGEKTSITSSVVSVEILGFSDPIEGKIDTGAAQSSLHAEEIEVDGDRVTFVLNDRRYRTSVKSSQEVSSADGGQQSRPVVTLTLTISGKTVDVDVNLNDRSEMPQQLLIGQDVIKGANLVIDISNEPADTEAGVATGADGQVVKPEQEEVPTGVPARPEVTSNSIAQLGDNPLAHKEDVGGVDTEGGEMSLMDVKTKLQELLAAVEKLIQSQG